MVFESGQIEVFDGEVERANFTVTAAGGCRPSRRPRRLSMGIPSPVNARGRAALPDMALGAIRLWGDLTLARGLLELMRIDVPAARYAEASERRRLRSTPLPGSTNWSSLAEAPARARPGAARRSRSGPCRRTRGRRPRRCRRCRGGPTASRRRTPRGTSRRRSCPPCASTAALVRSATVPLVSSLYSGWSGRRQASSPVSRRRPLDLAGRGRRRWRSAPRRSSRARPGPRR